jgi:hypothetical protein
VPKFKELGSLAMPFEKGQSGNPAGPALNKPFRDALRMELAAAGEDHKALRRIARNLIELASTPDIAAMPAINSLADRTDGKVAQAIVGGDEGDPAIKIETIRRIIVKPGNPDGGSVPAAPGA